MAIMFRHLRTMLLGTGRAGLDAADAVPQAGTIPYAIQDGRVAFLLVTSRGGGRWIFPKGGIEPGESPQDCAVREAREEAGVEGELSPEPVGAYHDRKTHARDHRMIVELYPLRVTRQLDKWKERGERKRHWATLAEARDLVTTPGLLEMAARAEARILAQSGPAS